MTTSEVHQLICQVEKNFQSFQGALAFFKDHKDDFESERIKNLLSFIGFLKTIEDEVIQYRIFKVINENHPYLPEIDPDEMYRLVNSGNSHLSDLIDNFLKQRKELISALYATPAAAWDRTGVLSNEGHVSLYDLVKRFLDKAEYNLLHLKKISS